MKNFGVIALIAIVITVIEAVILMINNEFVGATEYMILYSVNLFIADKFVINKSNKQDEES